MTARTTRHPEKPDVLSRPAEAGRFQEMSTLVLDLMGGEEALEGLRYLLADHDIQADDALCYELATDIGCWMIDRLLQLEEGPQGLSLPTTPPQGV